MQRNPEQQASGVHTPREELKTSKRRRMNTSKADTVSSIADSTCMGTAMLR